MDEISHGIRSIHHRAHVQSLTFVFFTFPSGLSLPHAPSTTATTATLDDTNKQHQQ